MLRNKGNNNNNNYYYYYFYYYYYYEVLCSVAFAPSAVMKVRGFTNNNNTVDARLARARKGPYGTCTCTCGHVAENYVVHVAENYSLDRLDC